MTTRTSKKMKTRGPGGPKVYPAKGRGRAGAGFWDDFWTGFKKPFEWIADKGLISKALPLLGPEAAAFSPIVSAIGLGKGKGRAGGAKSGGLHGSAPFGSKGFLSPGGARTGRGISYQPGLASTFSVAKF